MDDQLIALAKRGDAEAVGELYDKYVDAIYRYFYWQTGRDPQTAEDLTQDAFIQLAKSIKTFKGHSSFKNWLYVIAKRQVAAWVRHKYRLPQVPLIDNMAFEEDWIDPVGQKEKVRLAQKLLTKLNKNERQVIELRYLKGYSVIDAASELHLTPSNVKVLTHRAIKKLQEFGSAL